ncbi:MAG: hypothetical protein ACE5DN_03045, partial [Flavobacteriales bacterium]
MMINIGEDWDFLSCETCKQKHVSMFSELEPDETCMLTLESTCFSFKKGDTIFMIGTRPKGVYCIHTGKVKVARLGTDG